MIENPGPKGETPRYLIASYFMCCNCCTSRKCTVNHLALFCIPSRCEQLIICPGTLGFVDTCDLEATPKTYEHAGLCAVNWDPSGRFVVSSAFASKNKDEPGYQVYSCQGDCVQKHTVPNMQMFSWRPRPPTLLPKATIDKWRTLFRIDKKEVAVTEADKTERAARVSMFEAYDRAQHMQDSDENLEMKRSKRVRISMLPLCSY